VTAAALAACADSADRDCVPTCGDDVLTAVRPATCPMTCRMTATPPGGVILAAFGAADIGIKAADARRCAPTLGSGDHTHNRLVGPLMMLRDVDVTLQVSFGQPTRFFRISTDFGTVKVMFLAGQGGHGNC